MNRESTVMKIPRDFAGSRQPFRQMLHENIAEILTHWPLGDFNKILEK